MVVEKTDRTFCHVEIGVVADAMPGQLSEN